jgi:hypothetical protein
MRPLTPQEIAAATAKRQAAIAARKASGGMTVREQRAAAKAAKAGQPAPPPRAPRPPRQPRPGRGRRARFNNGAPRVAPVSGPVFATPAPNARALKLAGLVALEAAFTQKVVELGKGVTDELRDAYAKYKKCKALALGAVANSAMQNEADTALRLAVVALVKLTY